MLRDFYLFFVLFFSLIVCIVENEYVGPLSSKYTALGDHNASSILDLNYETHHFRSRDMCVVPT